MIREAIAKLAVMEHLSAEETYVVMDEIMSGKATEAQIAGFLMGLRLKGETVGEIVGCVRAMREKATLIRSRHNDLVDTCGTGGDGGGTFNISTTAAIIASGAGVPIAKHGNRAVSSQCGSADLLKALGVNIEVSPEKASAILDEVGITFLFAPLLHGAMKYVVNVRKELGVRTIFNVLGPMTNPAGAKRQVLGVFEESLTEKVAGVLSELGTQHALVVHGEGGLDELSTVGMTKVTEVKNGNVQTYSLRVEDFGLKQAMQFDLRGGNPEENAMLVWQIVRGANGAPTDIALLNAGAAIYVGGKAESINEGVMMAKESIRSGAAVQKLGQWIKASKEIDNP
jgi:anthranilate phosphoribosyltransferase